MAVTPEAAGSSPVDPATNYLQFRHFHTSVKCHGLRRDAGGRGPRRARQPAKSWQTQNLQTHLAAAV